MSYLLFGGAVYYSSGGAKDLIGKFDNIDEAVDVAVTSRKVKCEDNEDYWAHILDLNTLKIVKFYSVFDGIERWDDY